MPFICCLDYSIDHRKHKTIGKLILFDIRETESEIHKVGRRQRYLARSDFCCLAPCPPPPPPPARSQASAEKCPGKAPPTFICEATAILMKLDCVRPRHRKLSPDGRWTDMEFESAEMEKRESIRRRNTCPRAAFVFRLPSV